MGGAAREPGRQRETVRLGAVEIDLVSEGRGPLIVLLPSKARDSLDFDEAARGLVDNGWRVLRPQPRGAFASRGPEEGLRLEVLAADVAGIIEREVAGPAIVLGHAFGNWIARALAATRPDLVSGVVLAAASAREQAPEQRADVRTSSDPTRSVAERLAALRRSFFAPGHDPRCWLEGWHPEAARLQDKAVAASRRADYWSAGTAPVLDLVPEHDPFKPRGKWHETLEDMGGRASVVIISDASHALFPEQPAAVVAAVTAWAHGNRLIGA